MTVKEQRRTNVLADVQHAMNEHDALNQRLGVEPLSQRDRLLALVDITEQVLVDVNRYGMPLEGRLRAAIVEYARWLEAA